MVAKLVVVALVEQVIIPSKGNLPSVVSSKYFTSFGFEEPLILVS